MTYSIAPARQASWLIWRTATWRQIGSDLAYILPGFFVSIASFTALVALFTLGLSTIVIWIGLPVLVACLRVCTDDVKVKVQAAFEDADTLACLCQQLLGLEDYLVQHVLYAIWGKPEKLAALARKAQGRRRELLLALIAAAGNNDA